MGKFDQIIIAAAAKRARDEKKEALKRSGNLLRKVCKPEIIQVVKKNLAGPTPEEQRIQGLLHDAATRHTRRLSRDERRRYGLS